MDFDWDAIEDWFITGSGNMTYRQVAMESVQLSCFGYRPCSHEMVREKGKERLWMQKRAEYQAMQHSSIIGDYQASYDIVTKTLIERFSELSPTELAALGNLQLKYGDAIMALNPIKAGPEVEILTRDDVLRIARMVQDEIADLNEVDPLDLIAEERGSTVEIEGAHAKSMASPGTS